MEQISASAAKQQFGQVVKAAESGPVAIEKHGRIVAYMVSPAHFHDPHPDETDRSHRLLARANQMMVEKDRLNRHHRIAIELLTRPAEEQRRMINAARKVVGRWKKEQLCSSDYIRRWEQILGLMPDEMARVMVSDFDGWGTAIRQNSPWVGVQA